MELPGTDWEHFCRGLAEKLEEIPIVEHLKGAEEIDGMLGRLEQAVLETMEATVPKSYPSPYSKRWWNKDLERARREAR